MKLNILGKDWLVVFKEEVVYEGGKVEGVCDFTTKTFFVATGYPKEMKKEEVLNAVSEAFYHEFLHTAFHESAMRDQSYWSPDVEHVVIAPAASALAKNFPLRIKLK